MKLILASLVTLSTAPLAQSVTAIVSEGDTIAGVGSVTRIDNLAINDAGLWRVEVDTNASDTGADSVLLRSGVLELREGQSLGGGLTLDSFDAINVPFDGTGGWNLLLGGTSDDTGIFHGANLLLQEGDLVSSPAVSPGTTYVEFLEAKAVPGVILSVASIDDPAIASSVDAVLLRVRHDGNGAVLGEDVLLKEGDVPAALTEPVIGLESGPHEFALNASGQVLFTARVDAPAAIDRVVFLGSTPIAREGFPAGIAGRNWANLNSAEVDLNDFGAWVLSGTLDGDPATDRVIVKNGLRFVGEGDVLPDIAPFALESFGSGPVLIANNGDVLWYGNWSNPDSTRDQGLFLNQTLIAQEGVTPIAGGGTLTTVFGVTDAYAFSPNGRFVLFEGARGSIDEVYRIDRGGLLALQTCNPNAGRLAHVAGVPGVGQSIRFAFDDGLLPASLPLLAVSNTTASPGACGLQFAFGELVVGVAPPNPIVLTPAPIWVPGSPSFLNVAIPSFPTLAGREFWVQGLFAQSLASLRLTNAMLMTIGK